MLPVTNVPAAAKLLGVSIQTVRRFLREGALPHHRIGDRVIFTEDDLEKFLDSCAVAATREPTRVEGAHTARETK